MNVLVRIRSYANLKKCFDKEARLRWSVEREEFSLIFSLLKSLIS